MSGEVLYSDCISCHGEHGEGALVYGAPSIGGLPDWYIENQLRKFRGGDRGSHPDDAEGLRMRPMSWQIKNDRDAHELAEYISKMPRPAVERTLTEGDVNAGKTAYAVCTACHGPEGLGNQALNAPPIAGQYDWYLIRQLKKFKAGIRGTAPGDVTGATMRPMSMTLPDDTAMHNVIAYVQTLHH